MFEEYELNCDTFLQEISQSIEELFPSEEVECTMITVQMFTTQKNRCNLPLDDAATVLRNVTLLASSSADKVPADEVQRNVERALLAQQKSFSGNLKYRFEK